MKFVLLGAPGSGKGTLSDFLNRHYQIPHISTGDIFRDAMAKQSELGLLAKSYIDLGRLVPDDVTIAIVKERLSREDCKNGFILDGFPRTVYQAQELQKFANIDVVLYFNVTFDMALKRLLTRRLCSKCGSIYNMQTYDKTVCKKCGGELITRKDDNEKTIKERFEVYNEVTFPVIKYYQEAGLLKEFDANLNVADSEVLILKVIGE